MPASAGAIDTVAVASVTISYAMEAHAGDPAIAGLMMPLLRLQHTCSGNVAASSTTQLLLRVMCALQRLLAAALPAAATTSTPAGQAKDEPPTSSDALQLHALLTAELPRVTHTAGGSCVRCLRIATSEVLVMAVGTVERAPEAAASNAVSQQLLQILSSEALVAAAAATLGDSSLPQRARSAISVTLAVFREAAAATTVRKCASHSFPGCCLHLCGDGLDECARCSSLESAQGTGTCSLSPGRNVATGRPSTSFCACVYGKLSAAECCTYHALTDTG